MNSIIEFKSINLQTKNILHCNYKDNGYLGVKNKCDFLNVMKYSLTKRIKKRVKKIKEKFGESNSQPSA